MGKMTKRKKGVRQKTGKKIKDGQKYSAARDRREKKYYYDDAHGYEIYDPQTDVETDEN